MECYILKFLKDCLQPRRMFYRRKNPLNCALFVHESKLFLDSIQHMEMNSHKTPKIIAHLNIPTSNRSSFFSLPLSKNRA